MTGKGHRLTGVGAGFFAAAFVHVLGFSYSAEAIAALAAAFSTTLPDLIEIPIYKRGARTRTLIPHRTITHWPPLWFGIMYGAYYYLEPYYACALIGMSVGALAHILADAPNPLGIPWVLPHKRIALFGGLWRSGENEQMMVTVFTLFGVGSWLYAHQNTVAGQYLTHLWVWLWT